MGNNGMMMMLMMGALAIGGYFLLVPKQIGGSINIGKGGVSVKGGGTVGPASGGADTPNTINLHTKPQQSAAISIYPGFGVLTDVGGSKLGLPIIGASDYDHPREDIPAGMCQCTDRQCCYRQPFYGKNGLKGFNSHCKDINYGDSVDACNRALTDFTQESFYVHSHPAMLAKAHAAHQLAHARRARTGLFRRY